LTGTLDELSAWLGWARAEGLDPRVDATLDELQRAIFDVGAEVATLTPVKFDVRTVGEDDVKAMERTIDEWDAQVEPRREFVVPGGTKSAAALHVARTICRRAERRAVALLRFDETFSPRVVAWLNRVGDLLFALARFENARAGRRGERLAVETPTNEK
jgi:cob(I)alamin adenosyltransferase